MIGIKTKVTLERTLYLDLPDDASEADILKEAIKGYYKKEMNLFKINR